MKKWLPWIVTGFFAVWILSALRPKPEKEFHIREFGTLPVLLNGRIQPLDSVGRNALLVMRGKQTVALENGKKLPASEWLLEVLMKPELADERKVFRIDHPELLGLLRLPETEKHFSYHQLQAQLEEIGKQAERISEAERTKKSDPQLRTTFEKQLMKLYHALTLYQRLKVSLRPAESEDFARELEAFQQSIAPGVAAVRAREAGKEFDQKAFDRLLELLGQYEAMTRFAYPLMVPPQEAEHTRENWINVGASLLESARTGQIHPAVARYAAMASAYRHGQPSEFNKAVDDYQQWLAEKKFDLELNKGRREFFYNGYQPFYKSIVLYLTAFLLACAFWLKLSPWLNRSAFYLAVLALVVHTSGVIFRMVLEGRPPVTNLYSSAIFVGWGAVILGLVLERIYRDGIGNVTAACIGFLSLVVAHNLSLDGDTMEMLRAVLDTNFWLATHVVVITLGYASTFVGGFLAVVYILRGVFTRSLGSATRQALVRMVYGIVCFATLFSFVGTILGGIWADQSWGRFWGWDPKENGALLIVLWNAIILHVHWGGLLRERGLMAMTVFGNIVTSFSWFGVNMLGVGLHSYGFMDQAFLWLMVFVASQAVIMGLGMLPERYWASLRSEERGMAGRPSLAPAGIGK
ncbi:MAG: cytochrome c biogenesis protein CcsA [Verrucomicrobiota bacterium]